MLVMPQFCQSFHILPSLPQWTCRFQCKFLTIFTTFLGDSLNPVALACLFDFCADLQVCNNNIIITRFSPYCCQELLVALHERHEEWLIQKKFPIPAPVMVSKNTIHIEKFKNDSSVLTTAKKKELRMIMFLNKETE